MPRQLPSAGFFVATVLAALAIVGGGVRVFMEFQDRTNHFTTPAVIFALGVSLLVLAFGARSSRWKLFVLLRNGLILIFIAAIVCVLLIALRGGH